jgi:hypothetical protein
MISRWEAKSRSAGLVARKLRHMAYRGEDLRPAWPAVTRRAVEGYRRAYDQEGPGWRPLSPERIRQRIADGIPGAHPILNATGKTRSEVLDPDADEGAGFLKLLVDSDILFYHQVGTKQMPARPLHLRAKDGTWMAFEISQALLEAYRLG